MNPLLAALISIALSVCAQFLLKHGVSSEIARSALQSPFNLTSVRMLLMNFPLVAGFFLYGVGAILWLAVLSRWDVSKAYPLVGLGFVLSAAIGLVMGEAVSGPRLVGIALICSGVVVVSKT